MSPPLPPPLPVRDGAGRPRRASHHRLPSADARPLSEVLPAVELEGITKRFPGVVANKDISFAVAPRHGPRHRRRERRRQVDADEDPVRRAATGRGHHQGRRPRGDSASPPTRSTRASAWSSSTSCSPTTSPSSRTSSWARAEKLPARCQRPPRDPRISDRYGLDVDPDVLVEDLGVGARQRIEILKVLYRGARILILDEPTAVLVPQEVDELFAQLPSSRTRASRSCSSRTSSTRCSRSPTDHRDPARHDHRHGRPRRRSTPASSPS